MVVYYLSCIYIDLFTSKVGVLSTAYNNQPNSRYMVFYNDELTLYTKTSNESTKVEEIKK